MSSSPPGRNAAIELMTLADQCVLCGLCLPACPTYRIGRTEAESPRGRIALAKALATGALAPEPAALAHLDHCLGCLSCERVCPSGVQYGQLIDRQRQIAATAPDRLQRLIYALIARPRRLRRLARVSHALRLARWLSPLARRFARGRIGIAQERRDGGVLLSFWLLPEQTPLPGDRFSVTAGCDKSFSTCRAKFANHLNFRGFPHLPGADFAYSYAAGGESHDGGALFS